jgi:hypothetical protein
MKFFKSVALAVLLTTVLFSCKKDNDGPAAFTIEGVWQGKLGNGSATPTGFIGLNIKAGGVLERTTSAGSVSATGNWQLNGTAFTGTYTFPASATVVNISGTLDKDTKKITGNWSNNGNEEGTWYVTK